MCGGGGVGVGADKLMLTNEKRRDGAVVKLADNNPQAAASTKRRTHCAVEQRDKRKREMSGV